MQQLCEPETTTWDATSFLCCIEQTSSSIHTRKKKKSKAKKKIANKQQQSREKKFIQVALLLLSMCCARLTRAPNESESKLTAAAQLAGLVQSNSWNWNEHYTPYCLIAVLVFSQRSEVLGQLDYCWAALILCKFFRVAFLFVFLL